MLDGKHRVFSSKDNFVAEIHAQGVIKSTPQICVDDLCVRRYFATFCRHDGIVARNSGSTAVGALHFRELFDLVVMPDWILGTKLSLVLAVFSQAIWCIFVVKMCFFPLPSDFLFVLTLSFHVEKFLKGYVSLSSKLCNCLNSEEKT